MILFVSYVKAAVSVEANFSDPQCDGGMVCPNDPLLYTCTITETPISQTTIRLPFGYDLNIRTENEITVVARCRSTNWDDSTDLQGHSR